jgi:hypothetical protein
MIGNSSLKGRDCIRIYFLALAVRLLWASLSGLGPEAGADFERYNTFSDNILSGDFNLETRLFITAPLFPYALALAKLSFGGNWFVGLGFFQILISSASVVCLAAAANIIFSKRSVAITAGILYAICLPTIYYTHLPSQESLFQSFFVIAFYGLCRYNIHPSRLNIVVFVIPFTLALLTKSHVILMVPLVAALILFKSRPFKARIVDVSILIFIISLLTMPYGLYNLKVNGSYVISSSGSGGFFLTGHNDDFYQWLINTPLKDSAEYTRLKQMKFHAYSEVGIPSNATHSQRQSIYMQRGITWARENPGKALNLSLHNLGHHLQPGYSLRFQSLPSWLTAMAFNLPIYILAYIELVKHLKSPKRHLPAYVIFVTMIIFATVFYAQNRFRLITVEPIYVLYASPGFLAIGIWLQKAWPFRKPKFLS